MHAPIHVLKAAFLAAGVSLLISACGASSSPSQSGGAAAGNASAPASAGGGATGANGGAGSAGALSAEARSLATGDIPDSQMFLTYTDRAAGYSMLYPEGWTQRGAAGDVSFQDRNNVIHILIGSAAGPTAASVTGQLAAQRSRDPTLRYGAAAAVALPAGSAIKVTYSTLSAPSPVTGKRIQLLVDRYVLARGARVMTADLASPQGVDNIDAYRKIVRSLHWR